MLEVRTQREQKTESVISERTLSTTLNKFSFGEEINSHSVRFKFFSHLWVTTTTIPLCP